MKKLTKKEALDQGYLYCGYAGQEVLSSIEDMDHGVLADTIERKGDVFLSKKECIIEAFPEASDLLGAIDSSILRHEVGLEPTSSIISSYEKELQTLLDKMKNEIRKENATCTYELSDIKLIPATT